MAATQGRPADNWPITTKNVALILVDMQNIWVHPRGARYLPSSEDIVPKIQELLRLCHAGKVPVIYLIPPSGAISPMSVSSPISNRKPMTPTTSGAISKARRARRFMNR